MFLTLYPNTFSVSQVCLRAGCVCVDLLFFPFFSGGNCHVVVVHIIIMTFFLTLFCVPAESLMFADSF